jgi:hypothetical protein
MLYAVRAYVLRRSYFGLLKAVVEGEKRLSMSRRVKDQEINQSVKASCVSGYPAFGEPQSNESSRGESSLLEFGSLPCLLGPSPFSFFGLWLLPIFD